MSSGEEQRSEHMGRRRSVKSAFTLVELLVVVAIIALLTAILLPVFFSVRGKARQTVCVSNLRQIGLAISLYSQDYDDYYPWANDPSDTNTSPNIWASQPAYQAQVFAMQPLQDVLAPYIKNKDLWRCPGDSGYTQLDISAYEGNTVIPLNATPTAFDAFHTSYLYRTEIALLHTPYGSLVAYDSNNVAHEGAEVNVLMDGNGSWHGGILVNQKRYNELMGDGHVVNQNIVQFGQTWDLQLKPP